MFQFVRTCCVDLCDCVCVAVCLSACMSMSCSFMCLGQEALCPFLSVFGLWVHACIYMLVCSSVCVFHIRCIRCMCVLIKLAFLFEIDIYASCLSFGM